MQKAKLNPEQVDELNAIFGTSPRRKKRKKRVLVWDSALEVHELGDYQVIPLTSSWALRQEVRAMHHCVAGYDEMCFKGRARVFSIRDLMGRRLATMSLIFRDDYWHLEQLRGVENAEVCTSEYLYYDGERTVTQVNMTDMYYVAYDVARRYRKGWETGLLKLIFEVANAGSKAESNN